MISLSASTVKLIVAPAEFERYLKIVSDSTTVTRLGTTPTAIEMSMGFGITAYDQTIIKLPANKGIYAVSTGTPNISVSEAVKEIVANAILLR